MCKLNNIKDKEFVIYRLVKENYVGVTTNLKKRLLKHRNKSNFDISEVVILKRTNSLEKALKNEIKFQKYYKCTKGVRNQYGAKNPYAKQVLCLKSVIYYDTIKEACESLDYSYSDVRHKIKDENNKYLLVRLWLRKNLQEKENLKD